MENSQSPFKHNKDYSGIIQFRRGLIQQQAQNSSLNNTTNREPSYRQSSQSPKPHLTKEQDHILLNDSLSYQRDTTELKTQVQSHQQSMETLPQHQKQFLPFIQERDSIGRLIHRENQSLHQPPNSGDLTDKSKLDTYKQLLKNVSKPLISQNLQKRESSLCLNKMLNDFLKNSKTPFSNPASSNNLSEQNSQFNKGFIIKQDKVHGYCNDLDRISPFVKDQRIQRAIQEINESSEPKSSASRQSLKIPSLSKKRNSSEISLASMVFRNLNANSQGIRYQQPTPLHNIPKYKYVSKLQTPIAYHVKPQKVVKKQNLSYLDMIHQSDRCTPVSQILQKSPIESRQQFSDQVSQIVVQNDQELSNSEIKQVFEKRLSQFQPQGDVKFDFSHNNLQNETVDHSREIKFASKRNSSQEYVDRVYSQLLSSNIRSTNGQVLTSNDESLKEKKVKLLKQPSIEQFTQLYRQKQNNNNQSQRSISNNKVHSNFYVKAGAGAVGSQKSQNQEQEETFSELFKGVKVSQNDIDRFVKNDLSHFGPLQNNGEERIANFSQNNISQFMSDMQLLRNRARKLKKNINQMPESAMINLRTVEQDYNSRYNISIQF